MPPVQKQGSFVGKMGNRLQQAHEQHKHDETEYSQFSSLPGGISNGVAQLIEVEIFQVEGQGKKMAGNYCFRASGTVILPIEHKGIPIFGLRTTIMEMMCDTPESQGKRKTFDEHYAYILNELRKLGMDTSSMDVSSDEALNASLQALVESAPYFRFRTWQGEKAKTGPYKDKEPQVQHFWDGVIENFTPEIASAVEDDTQQSSPNGQSQTTEDKAKPQSVSQARATAKPATSSSTATKPQQSTKPTTKPQQESKPVPSPAKPTPKPATQKETTPDDIDPDNMTDDIDQLTLRAMKKDKQAQLALSKMWKESGLPDSEFEQLDTWQDIGSRLKEMAEEVPNEEATTNEEEVAADELEDEIKEKLEFKVGDVFNYRPRDKQDRPAKVAVQCKITKLDKKNETADLENLEDSRKAYRNVSWNDLEGDETED